MKTYLYAFILNTRQLGFDTILFTAGLAGGITFLTKGQKLTKLQKLSSVISGGFTANYLTPVVADWINLSDNALYGLAFLLGYGGLKSVESIFTALTLRIKKET